MKITAFVESKKNHHLVKVDSNGESKELKINSGANGFGLGITGGEFLFLAIASCFCNDLYREAKKRDILIDKVVVEASGEFDAEGAPGHSLTYKVKVDGDASKTELDALIAQTDKVAEIHNTLRQGVDVTLVKN